MYMYIYGRARTPKAPNVPGVHTRRQSASWLEAFPRVSYPTPHLVPY